MNIHSHIRELGPVSAPARSSLPPCLHAGPSAEGARVSRLRRAACFVVALMGLVPGGPVAAIVWDDAWTVMLNGRRLSVETFVSSKPPAAVAKHFAHADERYERFLVADGRILLSGAAAGVHWVAEVSGHPDGAQGYVSALYFDPSRRNDAAFQTSTSTLLARATATVPQQTGGSPDWKDLGWHALSRYRYEAAAGIDLLLPATVGHSSREVRQRGKAAGRGAEFAPAVHGVNTASFVMLQALEPSAGAIALSLPER